MELGETAVPAATVGESTPDTTENSGAVIVSDLETATTE